ncbi:MAG: GIY-YIG nuclease family protein [Mesorhizobium sp.]|nr:MAG: GIY-YIG nuclease family protein [Mesorhizobium sp.]
MYIGVTIDLARRSPSTRPAQVQLHQPLRRAAEYFDIADAIRRETSLKRWPRQWKIELIEKTNPEWFELFRGIGW